MSETRIVQSSGTYKKGVQSWIEANNDLIYKLITGETAEVQAFDMNMRLKMIAQLKLRNKELRMLRINRITDKLLDKIEVGVEHLMLTDIDGDMQYLPMYLQILSSIQEAAKNTNCEVEIGDALIFDTIESVAQTGIPEKSRAVIREKATAMLESWLTT